MATHLAMNGRTAARTGLTAAVLAALVGALTAAPAQAAPALDAFCEVPGQELSIAPVAGLADGQQVTWLSTVKGVTPTEFTGEYVGKLENGLGYDAKGEPRDLLLVKLDGDVVNGADGTLAAGVWAGASGSPVYDADGALIGAVSYGFSNLPDNVAGVTPAAYMKAIGDLPLTKKLSPAAQRQVTRMAGETATTSATATIRQLQPVRVTTGTTAARLDAAGSRIAKNVEGYRPVASRGLAIGGGADDGADYPIVAGGNIAVSYGYGAVGSASVGTVTAVCGDDVYAFGHPNEWDSALSVNIHGASAARIVPNLGGSYKMVSAIGKVKGHLVDDRLAGIRGKLGAGAPTIPITTKVTAGDARSTAVSHISEPLVIASAAVEQLGTDALRMLDNQWEGTAKVTWKIAYQRENGQQATLSNTSRYSTADGIAEYVGWDMADDIAMLQTNPFEEVTILGVTVGAHFTEGYRAARITGVQMWKSGAWRDMIRDSYWKVAPGNYSFRVVLSPVPGSTRVTEYVPFTATVPKAAKGLVKLSVGTPEESMEFPEDAKTFRQFVEALDANQRYDIVDRTRSYTRLNGTRYTGKAQDVAPTLIESGKRFTFSLKPTP
ncbi:hypothetical protein [Microbacterium terricola]|uniref:Peptidase S55 domain-containing protein n=1 Tax=Microbacterium terricola TaxID=344163 RepID=A0ABM8E243_9MICO|nr:hypothetical protein [Microbacterium terricola]UYK40434.1 hypothetical protein OAU46_01915 [Microbacterium terricola]BDV31846.1 hypothetical protein Microterr_25060 [Microbacterium terricola]